MDKQADEQANKQADADESAQARFDDLCFALVGADSVTAPTGGSGFGRAALRSDGKIFAMVVRGALVLKLPAARVDELVEAEEGIRFDANKGTPMKEWLSLDPGSELEWPPLATEALEFARATAAAKRSTKSAPKTTPKSTAAAKAKPRADRRPS